MTRNRKHHRLALVKTGKALTFDDDEVQDPGCTLPKYPPSTAAYRQVDLTSMPPFRDMGTYN